MILLYRKKEDKMTCKTFLIIIILVMLAGCTKKTTEPENSAPYVPDNPVPSNGAIDQGVDVNLIWTSGDPDGDPVRYDIYFGTSSPPPVVSNNQFDKIYAPGILDFNTQYYWKIVAKDNQDHTTEGSMWSFTTGQTPPKPPNLSIVADVEGDGVTISWDQIDIVDGYEVIIPDGDTISLNYDEPSYTDDFPLSTGTYAVYCVYETQLSDPATISSEPYASDSDIIISTSTSGEGSGFGWDPQTGIGTTYFLEDIYKSVIDFYLYSDSLTFDFYSADEPPYNGDKTTDMLNMGTFNFFTAPPAGYNRREPVFSENYYAMRVQGDYYAKVYIVGIDSVSATFNYEFQTIMSLRIF